MPRVATCAICNRSFQVQPGRPPVQPICYKKSCRKWIKRQWWILNGYGLSIGEYVRMLRKQKNRCAICRRSFGTRRSRRLSPHVDHDHKTKKVRALLCTLCNIMLGAARDNPNFLRRAISYIKRFST